MKLLDKNISPLGMGCWPIGGPFFEGDVPKGYSRTDDATSLRTLAAALDHGVTVFDTASVYGAGHAERLMGQALAKAQDALIITKIGIGFNEASKEITGAETDPATVIPAIERSMRRLNRECVDIVLLHLNDLPIAEAEPLFDAMETARQAGKLRAFGWSTDFPDRAKALARYDGAGAVEHAMHVFFAATALQETLHETGLTPLIRSPLAMGLLTGTKTPDTMLPDTDTRAHNTPWNDYFTDGRPTQSYLDRLSIVRDLLQTGGRSLTQGAICWLWGKSGRNIVLPGARTPEQIIENAGAMAFGPLPTDTMAEIERILPRPPEEPPRAR